MLQAADEFADGLREQTRTWVARLQSALILRAARSIEFRLRLAGCLNRMTSSQGLLLTRTYTRPFRVCIVIPEGSVRHFTNAVRAASSIWGGTRSLILAGDRDRPIGEQWIGMLAAFDPDAVFLHPDLGGVKARARLQQWMSRRGLAPFWVARLSSELVPEPDWRLASVGVLADESAASPVAADSLRSPNPVEVADLGSRPSRSARYVDLALKGAARRALSRPAAFLAGPPPSRPPETFRDFRTRPWVSAPFVYHERDDLDSAMWLWNIRSVRGALLGTWRRARIANVVG